MKRGKKLDRKLDARRRAFDAMSKSDKKGLTRPGSLNRKRGGR